MSGSAGRPLKVAFHAGALLAPLTGIGQYSHHLATGLMEEPGIDVDLFYGDHFSREIKRSVPVHTGRMRALVRKLVPNAYGVHRLLQNRHFRRGVRAQRYDVYHEPNYLALPFDGPTVITVHDLSWIRYPETHPSERVRAMERFFEPGMRRASLLLTDSEFVKREVVEVFGVDPARIRPVLLGLDPAFRPMAPEDTRPVLERLGLEHGQYFLSVGTLEPRKNMQATVAAYSRLPAGLRARHPLVLAGMKGWHTSQLESLLQPLVEQGHARMLGYLERADLATVTAAALSMVYPSIYEGFGLPPLESMGCGVPPIASTASSIPEVVGDGGLLVDPQDVDGLSDAMAQMALDPALRTALSARALLQANTFTWARCVRETADAYRLAASSA